MFTARADTAFWLMVLSRNVRACPTSVTFWSTVLVISRRGEPMQIVTLPRPSDPTPGIAVSFSHRVSSDDPDVPPWSSVGCRTSFRVHVRGDPEGSAIGEPQTGAAPLFLTRYEVPAA